MESSTLGRAEVDPALLARMRAAVRAHLLQDTRSLDGLDVEPDAPPAGMAFAFVADVPSLPKYLRHDRANWHRCSYCETDRKFIDGRIVLCADGRLRTIGFDCWKHHVGDAEWQSADEEWRTFHRRERFALMQSQVFPAALRLQGEVRQVQITHAASITFADRFSGALVRVSSALADALARKSDGRLTVERMVPDFGAFEGARGQRTAQQKEDATRYRPETHVLHRIAGLEILHADLSVSTLLKRATASLMKANSRAKEIDWEKVGDRTFRAELREFEKACTAGLADLDQALGLMRSAIAFLAPANIAGLIRWANDGDCELCMLGGYYEAIAGGLRYLPDRGDPTAIRLPTTYELPPFLALEPLRKLLFDLA